MNIRLIKPFAVFFPSRIEPRDTVHSIGGPRGQELIREGIAVEYHGQPSPDFSTPDYQQQPSAPSTPATTSANARQPDKAKIRSALVCAGLHKDCEHAYARPRDVRDRTVRRSQAAAAMRKVLSGRKLGSAKKSAVDALRAAFGHRAI